MYTRPIQDAYALPAGAEPQKLGQGSTRTVWSLPFGLVMKLNREDQPDTAPNYSHWLLAGMSWIDRRQSLSRRRHSTWREMTLAIRYPNLFPRIYGVLFAFGEIPQNPSVLIMEQVKPVSEVFGDNDADFRMEDMCIHPQTGRLQVYDKRISNGYGSEMQCDGKSLCQKMKRQIETGELRYSSAIPPADLLAIGGNRE